MTRVPRSAYPVGVAAGGVLRLERPLERHWRAGSVFRGEGLCTGGRRPAERPTSGFAGRPRARAAANARAGGQRTGRRAPRRGKTRPSRLVCAADRRRALPEEAGLSPARAPGSTKSLGARRGQAGPGAEAATPAPSWPSSPRLRPSSTPR
jgi:hypothetical protein